MISEEEDDDDDVVLLTRSARVSVTRGKCVATLLDGELEQDKLSWKKGALEEVAGPGDAWSTTGVEDSEYEELEVFSTLYITDELHEAPVSSDAVPKRYSDNGMVASGWAQLLPELLQEIATWLTDISDQVRFCAVCTTWRFSVNPATGSMLSCLPSLLLMSGLPRKNGSVSSLSFLPFSLSGLCIDPWKLGSSPGRICGTGMGWHVVVSGRFPETFRLSIFLWNPLTGRRIDLPPSVSFIKPDSFWEQKWAYDSMTAAISLLEGSESPATGCVVILTCFKHLGFSFYQYTGEHGNEEWSTVESLISLHKNPFISFVHLHGMVLALHKTGETLLVDIASLSRTQVAAHSTFQKLFRDYWYLPRIVESSGEVFLAVYMPYQVVNVFKLDLMVQPTRWFSTKDIGNCAMFLDSGNLQCLTVKGRDKLNLRKNGIYINYAEGCNSICSHYVSIFQLDDGTVEEFFLQFECPNCSEVRSKYYEECSKYEEKWFFFQA